MWRRTDRANLDKKPSMRLSHEPCLGVKVNSKRPGGRASSQDVKGAKALGKGVEAGLEGEQYREPAGAEIVDGEESILAILLCDIKRDAVEVLAFVR